MNKEKNDRKNNITLNLKSRIKKINIGIKIDGYDTKEEKMVKLPPLFKKKNEIINKIHMRKKLVNLENFCHSIYTNSNNITNNSNNNNRTLEDILNDSKLKVIDEIKNNFFLSCSPYNKEGNKKIKNNKGEIFKKIIYNKSKPNRNQKYKERKTENNEEKLTFLTTTFERNTKKEERNIINNSIDNNKNKKVQFNYADYASNKLILNHPKLYILNNKTNNSINELPLINNRNKKINIVEEISKIIPDKIELTRERKINQYDEYMRLKESKNI